MKSEMKIMLFMTLMNFLWNFYHGVLVNKPKICMMIKEDMKKVVHSYGVLDDSIKQKLYDFSLRDLTMGYLKESKFHRETEEPVMTILTKLANYIKSHDDFSKMNFMFKEKSDIINERNSREQKYEEDLASLENKIMKKKELIETFKTSLHDLVNKDEYKNFLGPELYQKLNSISDQIILIKADMSSNFQLDDDKNEEALKKVCQENNLLVNNQQIDILTSKPKWDVYQTLMTDEENFKISYPISGAENGNNEKLKKYVSFLKQKYEAHKARIQAQLKDRYDILYNDLIKKKEFKAYEDLITKISLEITELVNYEKDLKKLKKTKLKLDAEFDLNQRLLLRLTPDKISDNFKVYETIEEFNLTLNGILENNNLLKYLDHFELSELSDLEAHNHPTTFLNMMREEMQRNADHYTNMFEKNKTIIDAYRSILASEPDINFLLGVLFADLQGLGTELPLFKCFTDESFAAVVYFMSITDMIQDNQKFLEGFFSRLPENQSLPALKRILFMVSPEDLIEEKVLKEKTSFQELNEEDLKNAFNIYDLSIQFDLNSMFKDKTNAFGKKMFYEQILTRNNIRGEDGFRMKIGFILASSAKAISMGIMKTFPHMGIVKHFTVDLFFDQILEFGREKILDRLVSHEERLRRWEETKLSLRNFKNVYMGEQVYHDLQYEEHIKSFYDAADLDYMKLLTEQKDHRHHETYEYFLRHFNEEHPVISIGFEPVQHERKRRSRLVVV
jgi:hypothetical protein